MSVDVDVLAELAFRAIRWGETSGSVEGPYPLGLAPMNNAGRCHL
jgi:hypothetical protein